MELKVIVPTSLSEITLDQYQRFARLEGDEEFLTHKMLEIFCGVPLAEPAQRKVRKRSQCDAPHQYDVQREAKPKDGVHHRR
jgi:hypothetical protein